MSDIEDIEDIEERYGDSWLLALIRRNITDIREKHGVRLTLSYNPEHGGIWGICKEGTAYPLITFRTDNAELHKGLAFTHGFECGCEHNG